MERMFALYDSDVFYVTRFMDYFKNKDLKFELISFTQFESLQDFLKSHNIEVLLLGDMIDADNRIFEKVKYIYRFSDIPCSLSNSGDSLIYRYQPVQSLMDEIISNYLKRHNQNFMNPSSSKSNIITIFSLSQSMESLILSWSIANLLTKQGNTLLVMLDLLPIPIIKVLESKDYSLSEFIYYLKENKEIISKMKALIRYQGPLSYLTGISHADDILSLNKDDIERWVDVIKHNTDFETIIYYLNFNSEVTMKLMSMSDKVLIASKNSLYETALYQEWVQQMNRGGEAVISGKYIKLELETEELTRIPNTVSELKDTISGKAAERILENIN